MRQRVGALVIKDKKLLLVTSTGANFYWSPGGTIEKGETDKQTLARELDEELGVKVTNSKLYKEIEFKDDDVNSKFFIVEIDGELKPDHEVDEVYWYVKADYEKGEPKVSSWLTGEVIPGLIQDGLL